MKVRNIIVGFATRNIYISIIWEDTRILFIKENHTYIHTCQTCDAHFTQREDLSTHIKSQHQGVKFPFGLCDYQAAWKGSLSAHITKMFTIQINTDRTQVWLLWLFIRIISSSIQRYIWSNDVVDITWILCIVDVFTNKYNSKTMRVLCVAWPELDVVAMRRQQCWQRPWTNVRCSGVEVEGDHRLPPHRSLAQQKHSLSWRFILFSS